MFYTKKIFIIFLLISFSFCSCGTTNFLDFYLEGADFNEEQDAVKRKQERKKQLRKKRHHKKKNKKSKEDTTLNNCICS